jgi:hypothetical protein
MSIQALLAAAVATAIAFPSIDATTLDGRTLSLPRGLHGKPALVVAGFTLASRGDSQSWAVWAAREYAASGILPTYVTVVLEAPGFVAPLVAASMRRGLERSLYPFAALVVDPTHHIRNELHVQEDRNAQVFLLDRAGLIQWQAGEGFTEGNARQLARRVQDLGYSK